LKNPNTDDLAAFLRTWRARSAGPAVIVGAEDVPESLLREADVREVANPDGSLQTLAAVLERCTLFVGGDSGPLHLAAALSISAIAIASPVQPWSWGPFAPPNRVARVVGRLGSDASEGIRFDPDRVLVEAERLLPSPHRGHR
jgi:ADP-heptose:LPS heptosyltransferase